MGGDDLESVHIDLSGRLDRPACRLLSSTPRG
jgi:hypothetical protein